MKNATEKLRNKVRKTNRAFITKYSACSNCGSKVKLTIHHKIKVSDVVSLDAAVARRILRNPSNTTILCENCHKKHHLGIIQLKENIIIKPAKIFSHQYIPSKKIKPPIGKEKSRDIYIAKTHEWVKCLNCNNLREWCLTVRGRCGSFSAIEEGWTPQAEERLHILKCLKRRLKTAAIINHSRMRPDRPNSRL